MMPGPLPLRATILLAALLLLSPLNDLTAQPDTPRGRYDFHTVSDDGDPFDGTFHIDPTPDGMAGRLVTTLRPMIPLISAERDGDRFRAVAEAGPGARIAFEWTLAGDSIRGSWTGFGQTVPLEGVRVATDEDVNLEPVPCAAPGVEGLARCAVYHVWEDRAARSGRKIPIQIVVLPARSASAEPDPLVHFAGGPGQASTDQSGGNQARFAAINERRDIVMVDQRGTGGSNGLPCRFSAETLLTWRFSVDEIVACRERLAARADLTLYHTSIAVDDLDEIRDWLGYPALNLYGGSYGTRAALVYLRRHPDRVRTVTLRGVMPPTESFVAGNPADAQASIERLFDRCAAAEACRTAHPDLPATFEAALRRLEEAPVRIPIVDPLGGDSIDYAFGRPAFAWAIRRVLMDAELQPRLPDLIARVAEGDASGMRPGIEGTLSVTDGLYMGMGLSVLCTEDAADTARADIAALTAGTFLGDGPVRSFVSACDAWPRGTLPSDFHEPVRADVPVLILSGETDPTTPPRWGALVAETLPNSVFLVLPGASHAQFPPCAIGIMTALVESGTTAGLDTSCVADLPATPRWE